MKRIAISLVMIGALSFFAASCAKQTATTVDDQALTTAIQSKLYASDTARKGSVAVAVKDGAVTLSGDVPSNDVELEAMKIANGVTGVRSVSDQMKVTTAAVPAMPPPAADTTPAPAPPASNMASSKPPATAPEAKPEPAPTPMQEKKPIVPAMATIPAGTRLSVRTGDTIDSKTATEGQGYRGSLDSPLVVRGRVVVPAGSDVTLVIGNVKSAGRIKGNSSLSLRPTALQYAGKTYQINSSDYQGEGKARGKNTALKTGIGAAAGALIGGLAGGGKGAGIGAAAGGGAGFGWNAFTHGDQVKIPAETVLNFQLQAPLTVPMSRRGVAE